MDIKGALLDLATIRNLYSFLEQKNELKNEYLEGVNGFNANPLKGFKDEFKDVVTSLGLLDKAFLSKNNILESHEFVLHFENDVAEMDCVTFIEIDGTLYFVDIEVKDTEDEEQINEQFEKRETDNLPQLNLHENYILLGFLKNTFRKGIIKNNDKRIIVSSLSELNSFVTFNAGGNIDIKPLLKAVEGLLKIQDVKKKIHEGSFKYFIATKDGIDSVVDNVSNGKKVIIIYGNAGSGKTVVALSLFYNYSNVKLLIINKLLYDFLSMGAYYSSGRCFYGSDRFIESLDNDTIAIIDECQRLHHYDLLQIINKSRATILLGDNNQAFTSSDSIYDMDELKEYLTKKGIDENLIVTKKLKKTARYNSKVNAILEFLHSNQTFDECRSGIREKVGDEYDIEVTMSEESFIKKYKSVSDSSKIYAPFIDYPKEIIINKEKYKMAGKEDGDFSYKSFYKNYIGNTYHAISFDVDHCFVYLKGVGIYKKDGKVYLYDKSVTPDKASTESFIKFGNQINILFTRGKKSLHILVDDFYVYSYLNFKIKKGTK